MGLRAKLFAVFLSSLAVTVLLVGAFQIDRSVRSTVDDLDASATLLIRQTLNQIEIALDQSSADPVTVLRLDPALAAFLNSARVFSGTVIYVRIETPRGRLIAGTPSSGQEQKIQPFENLTDALRQWSPIKRMSPLWGEHLYEVTRPFEMDHQVRGMIRVGLTTAPLVAEVRQKAASIGILVMTVITVSLLAAMLAGVIVMRPVSAILAGIERLNAGNDSISGLDFSGGDELGELAQKFNLLSRRVSADRAQWEDERGQFINIFRSIADAVLLLDADGTIRFCNEEALTRLGLPGGGLAKGKSLAALLPEDHALLGIIRAAKASPTEVRDIAAEAGHGKKKLNFLVSVFPLGADASRAGQLIIIRDLKPVRQLEDVVDNSSRLARLGGLISGVAHQLRNPLNAMTLELELLSQDVRYGRPVEGRVQTVRDDMSQLAVAIDGLMRFMRPERLKTEVVAANEFVTEAARAVADPSIQVACNLDSSNPAIRADRAVLMEAIRNVVQNAVEAMPQGGKLQLATERNAGFVDISVADTGQGIPKEILDQVMHLYFTTKESGTGLGLPMALRAVDLHGGVLTLDSEIDAGTVVKIRLPAAANL